jgi:hypothetical protein
MSSIMPDVQTRDSTLRLDGKFEGYRTRTLQTAAPSLCFASANGRIYDVVQGHRFPL